MVGVGGKGVHGAWGQELVTAWSQQRLVRTASQGVAGTLLWQQSLRSSGETSWSTVFYGNLQVCADWC